MLDFATVTIASQNPVEIDPRSPAETAAHGAVDDASGSVNGDGGTTGGNPLNEGGGGNGGGPVNVNSGNGSDPVNGGPFNGSPVDASLIAELREMIGDDGMVLRATELKVYECDGWTLEKSSPEILLRPRTTAEVSAILKLLHRRGIPFVPRGAGTGLSGGCLPLGAPVMICTSRMNRILEIDYASRRIEVESGVVNLHVTNAVKGRGMMYAPDPSSQVACTIGGNVAENSGGPHTLKYGVTTNHVLGVEMVLPDGEIVELGGPTEECCGYDLVGAIVGSEGTTGIVTRATLKLTRAPEAYRTLLAIFADIENATRAVSAIIAAGIIPGAIEMMDQMIIRAVEAAFHAGLPEDAGAVLIIELDGIAAGLDEHAPRGHRFGPWSGRQRGSTRARRRRTR